MNERHAGNSWMVGLAGVFAVLLALTAPAGAQAPRLVVREDGQPKAMVLDELAVDVAIVGYIAETRLTMTYRNPHSRVLEGELIFPLPEGATVSGYALDVDGHMVDGVVVEKAKAQRVFETVVRRGVDPGLVEWVKGNTFRTRVYPLPAKGKRTVMVRYLSELEIGERAFAYRLPMAFDEKVSAFRLKMSVRQAGAAPAIVAAGPARLMFREGPAERTAEYRASNVRLAEDLVVEIPRADDRRVVVEQAADGWHYFCILDEPGGGAVGAEPAAAPDRVVIFWDASGSRARADRSRELELLRAYFGRFKNRSVAVELVAFRNVQAPPQAVSVTNGDTRALEAALAAVAYDGGTQLGCLTVPPPARPPSVILLFSDGNSTFGSEMPGAFAAPVYAVTADPAANHPLLRHVAESSGGEYIHLAAADPAAAAARVGRAPLLLRRAACDPAQVDQLLPAAGCPVAGAVILAGRLAGGQAAVALRYERGRSETRSVRFQVDRAGAPAGELLRTYWAQRKVRELMAFPEQYRAELVELGRRYGLVTPGTSLLVLERLDQYIEFEVEPPACFPEWREAYAQRLSEKRKEQADAEQRKIAQLINDWSERVAWWQKEFKNEPKPGKEGAADARTLPTLPSGGSASLAAPPRPPAARLPEVRGGGILQGTVRDDTGGAIPGVTLTLTVGERGRTAVTGEAGAYRFVALPAGEYQLHAALEGFKPVTVTGIDIAAGSTRTQNVVLTVAEIMEEIVVASSTDVDGSDVVVDGMSIAAAGVVGGIVGGVAGGVGGSHSDESAGTAVARHGRGGEVTLREWAPDLPYVHALRAAEPTAMDAVYLEHRAAYADVPGFYVDCADIFYAKGLREQGLRVLSNLAELTLEDARLLRVLARRLEQADELDRAREILKRVAELRPEEPQSFRDLALVQARSGEHAEALRLLNRVILGDWDRFAGIELIALMEANALIPAARAGGVSDLPIAPELVQLLDVDLRIVLTWDSDATDIDLHVIEPGGETVRYNHNRSAAGGRISRDFTDGYGPEEYLIRKAAAGAYTVAAHYYGTNRQKLAAPVTLQVDIYTDFGRTTERRRSITLRLAETDETVTVGDVKFER
ncbi:MAG: carboxypeptidase regulatory-like domain-containing protein [Acidobacteria bacterium]|nr:carboxypeptidase regulatory-like domain-containing protein [Acidobacteriota bacterium]HNU01242.1 VIT domain-containing protein [Acidobacteriota bacterium]